jgi:hypothetical protein
MENTMTTTPKDIQAALDDIEKALRNPADLAKAHAALQLLRQSAAPVQADHRAIADATNALRKDILELWPDFKGDTGRLRTVLSKHIIAAPVQDAPTKTTGSE